MDEQGWKRRRHEEGFRSKPGPMVLAPIIRSIPTLRLALLVLDALALV
jgi:hypothetical protein